MTSGLTTIRDAKKVGAKADMMANLRIMGASTKRTLFDIIEMESTT
jgi:hypothetical protein